MHCGSRKNRELVQSRGPQAATLKHFALRDGVAKLMSPEQVGEAQALAANWRPNPIRPTSSHLNLSSDQTDSFGALPRAPSNVGLECPAPPAARRSPR